MMIYLRLRSIAVVCLICVSCLGCARGTSDGIERIIADMTLPHEGKPHGVPATYDWAGGPLLGRGNDARGFRAMTAWGQLYRDADSPLSENTRVQIRNIQAYVLSRKAKRWRRVQNALLVEGAFFREDFADNVSFPADTRPEPDGSISVSLTQGCNYHFWPITGRVEIDPADLAGVYTTVEARLVVEDPRKPDNRHDARYVLSMGGDYWIDLIAPWSATDMNNAGIGVGRFRYVTGEWQSFHMITLNGEETRGKPPPLKGDMR